MRESILRKPIGLVFTESDIEEERHDAHLLGLLGSRLVAGLAVRKAERPVLSWKIRQVAVEEEFRGGGFGRQLVLEVIERALAQPVDTLYLHSRVEVVDFYERLGFESVGERFEEVGIPHQKMVYSRKAKKV